VSTGETVAKRFRYLATVQKGRLPINGNSDAVDADLVPYLTMEYLRNEIADPPLISNDPRAVVANDGDLLLLWDGSNAGEFLRAKSGIVSSTAALVTSRGVDREYLYWACKALEDRVRSETVGMGIPHVNGEYLANLRVPTPHEQRQRAIADYLDRETARIDALIAAKERVLALLAEKRRALITRAVTRGLDPHAPLRDSGIPWLGEIPAHWETERARWLFRELDIRSETGDEELLTVSHLTGVTPRSEKDVNMFEAETNEGYKLCEAGDLVINTLWAWMGAMGVSPMNGIVSPAYNVYRPGPRLLPAYIDALARLPVFAQEVTRYSKGVWSSRLRLYPEGFFEVYLPLPPQFEQRAIVEHIARETAKLDALRAATERTIALLKERRSALIAAAVTGQIDVGGSA
jgi:type I restriction enzyme S subunit